MLMPFSFKDLYPIEYLYKNYLNLIFIFEVWILHLDMVLKSLVGPRNITKPRITLQFRVIFDSRIH